MKAMRWLWLFAAGAILGGCASPKSSGGGGSYDAEVPAYVTYSDVVLLRWVSGIIHQRKMTDLPASSLIFLCEDSSDGHFREVEVRENHLPPERLNPDAAKRLFVLRINRQNGELTTDATRFDGQTYPNDGSFRILVNPVAKHRR